MSSQLRWGLRLVCAHMLAAVVGVFALCFVAAASAPAATWTVREVPDGPTKALLFGVSCPSASLCVAVGSNSSILSSTNPAGGASAWSAFHPEGYFEAPGQSGVFYSGNQIKAVSCPSAGLCVAAGPQGHFLSSTDPAGGISAWKLVDRGLEATRVNGISCPTPSLCVAVGQGGKVVSSTDPTGDASTWTVVNLDEAFDLRGVSCPSPSLCVAVDLAGNILSSTNPIGGASAWGVARAPAGPRELRGIDCPSISLCVTGNAGQMITSTDPTNPSSWRAVAAGTGLPTTSVSCPAVTACAAVDNNADLITSTDPTGGASAWSFVNVLPAPLAPGGEPNGMFGISCPSGALCAAVGTNHQIITSTDPFSAEPLPAIGNPKRPRVKVTSHPPKRISPRKGGAKVAFRFRAIGRASRFKCKLDGPRFSVCKSPVRYRAGRGMHAFKVFAIGPTGLKGPPSTFHFRVGQLVERPPLKTCAPGQESTVAKPCIEQR